MSNTDTSDVLRIIDANLNRLREAIRVIEEFFRFIASDTQLSVELKQMRHAIKDIHIGFDYNSLLGSRDTKTDPFANKNRKEELVRDNIISVLTANFKRGQEAARVLEEYCKVSACPELSENAKRIRFSLYSVEKKMMGKK